MAGNRARFEEAVQKANDLVWKENWPEATQAYRRALEEFPDDAGTLLGYAWSLYNANELDEAQTIYRRLIQLRPKDAGPYDRLGEILERQGQHENAAVMYLQAAERYRHQGLSAKAIAALEATVRNNPHTDKAWAELLKHYQEKGEMEQAILATLWLSHLYQAEHPQWAVELCRQMQRTLPHEPRLAQAMALLQSGRPLPPPAAETDEAKTTVTDVFEGVRDSGSLTEITRQRALEELAESIFAEEQPQATGLSQQEVNLLITKAVDAQTQGDLETALQAYERLDRAGVAMPSIHFNLGLLYKERMRFDEAIVQFEQSLADPEYVLGSQFALGECYQVQGDFDKALAHFLEAVKIVDLTTVKREQANDLIRVYEGLAQSLVSTGEPERVQQLGKTLVDFLSQRGWEEEVIRARKRLDGLARSGTVLSLVEIISLPGSEEILRSVALAQEYSRRKKYYLALEELFHTIGKAPLYLPLHHLLASFFLESGNLEGALDKFHTIAHTYEIRGEIPQALATYQEVLSLSPLDIAVHQKVIELLIQRGRIDDALSQYLQLADAYYQLAQPERSRDVYGEALTMAPRGTPEQQWSVRILHRRADLDLQRLDWTAAIKDYEEITRTAPDDERAHLALLKLYPRVGRAPLGMATLDKLIRRYLETRRPEKAVAVLEELVEEEPENIPLRGRLSQLYLNLGRREQALQHLDILGDLQLNAGQQEAAIKTIEAILALNPPNNQDYVHLYQELTGHEPPIRA